MFHISLSQVFFLSIYIVYYNKSSTGTYSMEIKIILIFKKVGTFYKGGKYVFHSFIVSIKTILTILQNFYKISWIWPCKPV